MKWQGARFQPAGKVLVPGVVAVVAAGNGDPNQIVLRFTALPNRESTGGGLVQERQHSACKTLRLAVATMCLD